MKFGVLAVFSLLSVALAASSSGKQELGEHPIAKIIAMLEKLKVQAREEGEKEAVLYQKFEYWCKNTKKELSSAIKEEKAKIATLEDKLAEKTKLKEAMEKDIAELEKSAAAGAKADKIREDSKAAYEEADKDFKAT